MGNVHTKQQHRQSKRLKRGRELVQRGNSAYKKEQYKEAIELHTQALDWLDDKSLERANCLDYLVKEYWRLGHLDEALMCSKETLVIKEQRIPGSSGLAKSLSDVGCIFHERGEYDKALVLLEGALAIREKAEPGSLGVAISCTNLALTLTKLGRRADARARHEQAQKIKETKAAGSVSLARTYISLSNMASSLDEALNYLKKAKAIAQNIQPVPTSLLASLEVNQGNLLHITGNHSTAIQCYEHAIEIEQNVAPDSLIMATMLDQLAKACDEVQGLQPEARAARGKSLKIRHQKAPTSLENKILKKG